MCLDLSEYTLHQIKKKLSVKIDFQVNNENLVFFLGNFFFKLFPKFIYFKNSDNCIGKIISKSNKQYPVFIQKKICIE